jgi:predicted Zn-dependent protease
MTLPFDSSEDKILTLLADDKTKKEYLTIFNEIESFKKAALSGLKKMSGSSNYELEIIETFSYLDKKNIFEIFEAILNNIETSKDSFEFKYNDVFDKSGKVKKFLAESLVLMEKYIEKYNDLISKSDFFAKNTGHIFGTTEAKIIGKSLEGDEYFSAGHKLVLKSHGDVSAKNKLLEIIDEEISKVFNDKDLKDIFNKIDTLLDANKELQTFKKVIEKDNSILLRLGDYDLFRREVWFSFLKQIETSIKSLVELYNQKKDDLEKIIQKAKDSQSQWEAAIKEFENRFVNNPFTLEIRNKADAVLNEETPAIDFKFQGKDIERNNLIENILSQGEKRAFYILNVIFEIKSRQLQDKKTLFIIDDIADSFDYKNKYAIVEYLNDLSKEDNFCSIILTHNFDFFRTLQSRILQDNKWKYSFVAERLSDEIKLIKADMKDQTLSGGAYGGLF